MKKLSSAALIMMLAGGFWQTSMAQSQNPVVVELFTSQGCYSCPPAEQVLKDLAGQEGIIPLEFHVDYWDYIGWKDPFASKAYTNRQQVYARHMNKRYVYTPQMVFNGHLQEVGSRKMAVEMMIEQEQERTPTTFAELAFDPATNKLNLSIRGREMEEDCEILLVHFEKRHVTEILRGENRGKTLENRNIVTKVQSIQDWRGGSFNQVFDIEKTENRGMAVMVQEKGQKRILAADIVYFDAS